MDYNTEANSLTFRRVSEVGQALSTSTAGPPRPQAHPKPKPFTEEAQKTPSHKLVPGVLYFDEYSCLMGLFCKQIHDEIKVDTSLPGT